jgi:hypothetical protein
MNLFVINIIFIMAALLALRCIFLKRKGDHRRKTEASFDFTSVFCLLSSVFFKKDAASIRAAFFSSIFPSNQ